MKLLILTILAVATISGQGQTFQDFLNRGEAEAAKNSLSLSLKQQPANDAIRMERDMATVIAGIEHLMQQALAHGIHNPAAGVYGLPQVSSGATVSYTQVRDWLKELQNTLEQASTSLEQIQDISAFRFTLDVTTIQFKINNGTNGLVPISDARLSGLSRFSLYSMPVPANTNNKDGKVQVGVADARWLEGYCKLVSATIDCLLAYNEENCFNHAAHLFFDHPVTPFGDTLISTNQAMGFNFDSIMDAVALIHTINFSVQDAARLQHALANLEGTIAQSRRMVKLLASQDASAQHWLAGPGQRSVTGRPVTAEMLSQWGQVLEHTQAILDGKELAPYWRNAPGKGVNVRKLFTEPKDFDLVLWLQGTGAIPYLEEGAPITITEWGQSTKAFNGQFLFYAFWFN